MKCPHCLMHFAEEWETTEIGDDRDGEWGTNHYECAACGRLIIELTNKKYVQDAPPRRLRPVVTERLINPKGISRSPLPPEIPNEFSNDYKEACAVLPDSPKASAVLSRRCLQHLLREKARTTKRDLADQIQEVLDSRSLPGYLADNLDAVRNIGNFAAHPTKSKSTGEIVDVEPGEAEWNLDMLEGLYDFYFVQPAKMQQKRDQLNQKLQDMEKPPMHLPWGIRGLSLSRAR